MSETREAALNAAIERMNQAGDAYEAVLADEAASDEKVAEARAAWETAKEDVERREANAKAADAIAEARKAHPVIAVPAEPKEERKNGAVARGELKHELTYRPDTANSFFRDLLKHRTDRAAAERLGRNDEEQRDLYEQRNTTVSTDGQFIPPIYLGEQWAALPRAGRAFANVVPKLDLPADGLNITVPKVSGGASEAVQSSQAGSVSSTDPTFTTVTASLVTIAGQVDIARQAMERSFPGLDMVIYKDLANAYDVQLDTQLLSGSGSSGQHLGIRNVSSVNTATASTTTPVSVLGQIYNGSQLIASNRYMPANVIVMHPRRAAWLASPSSNTNVPLFQQGGLFQAFGTQDSGFAGTLAGLPVVLDANIGTTYGAGTNQDEVYVLHMDDLFLMESPVRQATYEDVGSGSLLVRLQLFGYSFFVPHRQAKSIAIVSGAGLATPSF